MNERIERMKALWNELTPDEKADLFEYFESREETDEPLSPEEWQDAWIDEINAKMKAKYG